MVTKDVSAASTDGIFGYSFEAGEVISATLKQICSKDVFIPVEKYDSIYRLSKKVLQIIEAENLDETVYLQTAIDKVLESKRIVFTIVGGEGYIIRGDTIPLNRYRGLERRMLVPLVKSISEENGFEMFNITRQMSELNMQYELIGKEVLVSSPSVKRLLERALEEGF